MLENTKNGGLVNGKINVGHGQLLFSRCSWQKSPQGDRKSVIQCRINMMTSIRVGCPTLLFQIL